jgi:hypothetical protein
MACCSDQFDPAREGLVIGSRSNEGGQEGMVDIDDGVGKSRQNATRIAIMQEQQETSIPIS